MLQPAETAPATEAAAIYGQCLETIGIDVGSSAVTLEEAEWSLESHGLWGVGWWVHLNAVPVGSVIFVRESGGAPLEEPALRFEALPLSLAMVEQRCERMSEVRWADDLAASEVLSRLPATTALRVGLGPGS